MRYSFLLIGAALTGCTTYAQQPRALGLGPLQPACLFLCTATSTQTDAEKGATQSGSIATTSTVNPVLEVDRKKDKAE